MHQCIVDKDTAWIGLVHDWMKKKKMMLSDVYAMCCIAKRYYYDILWLDSALLLEKM